MNEQMNQHLLEHLDKRAWRAEPPSGNGRTIAAIFAHMHHVRRMWLVVSAKGARIPAKLDRPHMFVQAGERGTSKKRTGPGEADGRVAG